VDHCLPAPPRDEAERLQALERPEAPAWTGTGRPPIGTYTRRTARAWLDAKPTDLRRGIGIAAGLTGVPETYYLNARGLVVAHSIGVSRDELERRIALALAEE
jgi:hypothetical protein